MLAEIERRYGDVAGYLRRPGLRTPGSTGCGTGLSLLELHDVEARYGEVRALHGVTLSVEDGDFVAVLGANGAGKTTILRAISGTVKTTGDVIFAGEKSFGAHRRRWRGAGSLTCPRVEAPSRPCRCSKTFGSVPG